MQLLANFFSVLSLFCGFVSIIFSIESQFTFAAWAILSAVIFDGLDGQVARASGFPGEFGKELDSLIDVVSFGVAPAILGYIFIYYEFHFLGIAGLFFYLFCGIMRLARYNITPKKDMVNCFIGLPTTMSGAFLASFILIFRKSNFESTIWAVPEMFLGLVVILSLLMISHIRYLSLDGAKKILGKTKGFVILGLAVLLGLGLWFNKAGIILFILLLFYLIFSPVVVKKMDSQN